MIAASSPHLLSDRAASSPSRLPASHEVSVTVTRSFFRATLEMFLSGSLKIQLGLL